MLGLIKRKLGKGGPPVVGSCSFTGKIFVIGLSGTGTRSLHYAFRMLGIKSCHNPLKPEYFDEYQALLDIPVACRFKLLDKLYPGSRFIHTTRDLESWLDNRSRKPQDRRQIPFWMMLNRMETYGRLDFEREAYIENHKRWASEIESYFDGRDDCLHLNILGGEGWEKLCPFLDAKLWEDCEFPKIKNFKHKNK